MTFDINKFRNVRSTPRTKEVEVPQLSSFFEADEKPVFKIRNLTGHEVAVCNEAVKTNSQLRAVVEKMVSDNAKEKAAAICESLGVSSDKTPDDLVRRINVLRLGSIEPEFVNEDAVRFASMFPIPFYNLTNHILNLTDSGADLGESNASGTTQK